MFFNSMICFAIATELLVLIALVYAPMCSYGRQLLFGNYLDSDSEEEQLIALPWYTVLRMFTILYLVVCVYLLFTPFWLYAIIIFALAGIRPHVRPDDAHILYYLAYSTIEALCCVVMLVHILHGKSILIG